jgi:uncharacterized protein (TIGR03000 family)
MKKRWFVLAAACALALLLAGPGGSSALVFGQGVVTANGNARVVYPGVGYASYSYPGPVAGYSTPTMTHSPYSYAGYGTLYAPGYGGVTYAGYRPIVPSSWAAASYSYVAFFPPSFPGSSPAAAPPAPPTDTSVAGVADSRATVQVEVPSNATVWFNGVQTKQGGSMRTFETPALERGYTYHYDVKARWEENGKPVERTRRVEVYPGGRVTVAFAQPGE